MVSKELEVQVSPLVAMVQQTAAAAAVLRKRSASSPAAAVVVAVTGTQVYQLVARVRPVRLRVLEVRRLVLAAAVVVLATTREAPVAPLLEVQEMREVRQRMERTAMVPWQSTTTVLAVVLQPEHPVTEITVQAHLVVWAPAEQQQEQQVLILTPAAAVMGTQHPHKQEVSRALALAA